MKYPLKLIECMRDEIIKAIRDNVYESEQVADHVHERAAEQAADEILYEMRQLGYGPVPMAPNHTDPDKPR